MSFTPPPVNTGSPGSENDNLPTITAGAAIVGFVFLINALYCIHRFRYRDDVHPETINQVNDIHAETDAGTEIGTGSHSATEVGTASEIEAHSETNLGTTDDTALQSQQPAIGDVIVVSGPHNPTMAT